MCHYLVVMTHSEPLANLTERRTRTRFPIERTVKYSFVGNRNRLERGTGTTVNVSSHGVLFTTEHTLPPGKQLELAINWPAQLNGKCALQLMVWGRVLRCENGRAAIQVLQYEFRTSRAAAA